MMIVLLIAAFLTVLECSAQANGKYPFITLNAELFKITTALTIFMIIQRTLQCLG